MVATFKASITAVFVSYRGFFSPVLSLLLTSLTTRDARAPICSSKKLFTELGSRFESSRNAHDRAFTTISSRSLANSLQIISVRVGSPSPPRALLLSGTVLTSAARRHQRSFERAQRRITRSLICPLRHAGPAR